jgi:hypothetical protein
MKQHIKLYEDFVNESKTVDEGFTTWNPGKPKMARTVYDREGFFEVKGHRGGKEEVQIAGETKSGKYIGFSGALWTKDGKSWTPHEGEVTSEEKSDIKAVLTAWKDKIDPMIKDQPYMLGRKNNLIAALNSLT